MTHVDASSEEECNKEIARRIEELDSGKVKPIPWEEARRQISAMLRNSSTLRLLSRDRLSSERGDG
jgi:hypothetical protein